MLGAQAEDAHELAHAVHEALPSLRTSLPVGPRLQLDGGRLLHGHGEHGPASRAEDVERHVLEMAFSAFDIDGSGTVVASELLEVFRWVTQA